MKYFIIPNAGDGCRFPTTPEPLDAEAIGAHITGRLQAMELQGHWRDNRGRNIPLDEITYEIVPATPDDEEEES